jgi:1-acyl-sn-glycerol-3-phosphate acyltransferase
VIPLHGDGESGRRGRSGAPAGGPQGPRRPRSAPAAGPTRRAGVDAAGPDPAGPGPAGTDPAGTGAAATDPAGTDPAGTDPAGTDPTGSSERLGTVHGSGGERASRTARTGTARSDRTGAAAGRVPAPDRPDRPAGARSTGPDGAAGAPAGTAGAAAHRPGRPETAWERRIAGGLAFLRRRITGDYEVDDFGFDRDLTEHVLAPPFRPLYEKWFRVEATGLQHVPSTGGALVVANHSGTLPVDAIMTALALLDHHPAHRPLRMLGADLVFRTPAVGPLARKSGQTLACNPDAERLLGAGELVGVWPEGFKGIGKPFADRYKLQRFGRGGFVSAALRTRVPIVPVSIVGAEEIYPMLGNAKALARLLGVPYVPITPTFPLLGPLGLIPLPSKWLIEFGEPIETAGLPDDAADDPMLVFNLTDQVRETIQQTLYRLLLQRQSVFR